MILTVLLEASTTDKFTLEIDMTGIDKKQLMEAVLALQRCSNIAT